jgi:lysophospholipase L1-like esterase
MAEGMTIVAALAAIALAGATTPPATPAPAPAPAPSPAATITVTPAPAGMAAGIPLPLHVGGRVDRTADGYRRQWPGTYLEGAFRGTGAALRVGPGDAILTVSVDGRIVARLVKPPVGLYRVDGLTPGRHVLRVDVASESQAAPTMLGGLYATGATTPLPAPTRPRRIEFIGDSHTVGYGNTSTTRDCSDADVWATTDTAQGIAGRIARRYDADYQVNAISGRGVVRNYGGGGGDTLPAAYPYVLLDKANRYTGADWHPQLIVIALGTNDFSTPLRPGEPWATRAALRADYEARYVAFVGALRAAHPRAQILLWATDLAEGEIATETGRVAARLRASGDRRVDFVPAPGLTMSACHFHPSTADDQRVADRLTAYVDAHPGIWSGR